MDTEFANFGLPPGFLERARDTVYPLLYPITLLFWYFGNQLLPSPSYRHPRQKLIGCFLLGVICSHLRQAINAARHPYLRPSEIDAASWLLCVTALLLSCAEVWCVERPKWIAQLGVWLLALGFELLARDKPPKFHHYVDKPIRLTMLLLAIVVYIPLAYNSIQKRPTPNLGNSVTGDPTRATQLRRNSLGRVFKVFRPFFIPAESKLQGYTAMVLAFDSILGILGFLVSYSFGMLIRELETSPLREIALYAPEELSLSLPENVHRAFTFWIVCVASKYSLSYFRSILWTEVVTGRTTRVFVTMVRHALRLGPAYHQRHSSDETLQNIADGESMTKLIDGPAFRSGPNLVQISAPILHLLSAAGPIPFAIMLSLSAATGVYTAQSLPRSIRLSQASSSAQQSEKRARRWAVKNWDVITRNNRSEDIIQAYEQDTKRWLECSNKSEKVRYGFFLSQQLLSLVGMGLCVYVFAVKILSRRSTLGDLFMFHSYAIQFNTPMHDIMNIPGSVFKALVMGRQSSDMLSTKPDVVSGDTCLSYCQGPIEIEHASFAYTDKQDHILKEVNISLPGGKTIGIVGESGSGKTTLLNLIRGNIRLERNCGSVSIEGIDIKLCETVSLRNAIGIMPQTGELREGTIFQNVIFARPTATEQEVYQACRTACIHDFIIKLDAGYDTRVGKGGMELSGGQVQRIRLAMELLKDPPILLLDEYTSGLDTKTRRNVKKNVQGNRRGRTTFIASHQLASIKDADYIVVMKAGRIVEHGTHKTLLLAKGEYAGLWKAEFHELLTEFLGALQGMRLERSQNLRPRRSGSLRVRPRRYRLDSRA